MSYLSKFIFPPCFFFWLFLSIFNTPKLIISTNYYTFPLPPFIAFLFLTALSTLHAANMSTYCSSPQGFPHPAAPHHCPPPPPLGTPMAAEKSQGTLCSFPTLPLGASIHSSQQGIHQAHSASQCSQQNQEWGYKGAELGGAALAPPQNAPIALSCCTQGPQGQKFRNYALHKRNLRIRPRHPFPVGLMPEQWKRQNC